MNVAIIPARSGSKRIPKKNVKPFFGKPMIRYSIDTALESKLFDQVIVSTDSEEIADIAKKAGASVPGLRPAQLADDYTPIAKVALHVLKEWLPEGNFDYACLILATAPFMRTQYLREGFDTIRKRKVSSVFSVTSFGYPIFRALKRTEEGHLKMFWPEHELTRSNDLPEAYHDAGQFYWLDIPQFLKNERLFTADAMPVILPRHHVQDIDTPEDWEVAESIFRNMRNST